MSVIETAIGWLAPAQCVSCGQEGSALCLACSTSEILPYGERCWRCGALSPWCRTCIKCQSFGGPRFVWITTDYEATAKGLIQLYKFGHTRAAALPISRLMIETLLTFNSDADIQRANYLVVPIPTASSRRRRRSFDQAEILAAQVAKSLKLEKSSALGRLGQSRQMGANRELRLKQLEDNYFVRSPRKVSGHNVLLIDDVVTTGATLRAATKTLRAAGAKHVDALVFAKRL